MATQVPGPAQGIPLSAVSTGPAQGSGSQDSQRTNNDDYAHAHARFCLRWLSERTFNSGDEYTVDIVTVPAVGGHPLFAWSLSPKDSPAEPTSVGGAMAWVNKTTTAHIPSKPYQSPWIINDLPKVVKTGRILVYSHGKPEERSTIDSLATLLLDKILEERSSQEQTKKPLFFIGHSTGGLIIKAALIKARGHSRYCAVGDNCYGVAFFATPHQGSSYLSSPTYSKTIKRALGLFWSTPRSFQKQLNIKSDDLILMAGSWMRVAAELKLWTFYETIDTNLTDGRANDDDRVTFQAPITSIKSAILELHHEIDRPLQANHADCAAFGLEDEYTKWKFIRKLRDAATHARLVSLKKHTTIGLDKKVEVEVHGFYVTSDKIAGKQDRKSIRLWSTSNPLVVFLKDGPAKCLQNRLQEKTVPPNRTQMINKAKSRRKSFIQPGPSTNTAITQNSKQTQRLQGSRADASTIRPVFNKLRRRSDPAAVVVTAENSQRRSSRSSRIPVVRRTSSQRSSTTIPDAHIDSQAERQSVAMPSVTVSEHGDAGHLLQSFSGFDVQERGERTMGVGSEAEVAAFSATRTERLSPSHVQLRPSLTPIQSSSSDDDSDHSGTESNKGEAPTAGPPTRPDPDSQKLVWIHLAFNNPKWVSDIFSTISKERNLNKPLNETLLHDTVWCKRHIRGRNTRYHACFVKPGCVLIHPQLSPPSEPPTPSLSPPLEIKMSLYLPYLHWDTYRRMVKRREFVEKRLDQGRARPTPGIDSSDLELLVAWKYLGYDPPFHTRRTLDQFGYPNLADTRARDDDQMLYKMTKNFSRDREEALNSKAVPKDTHRAHSDPDNDNDVNPDSKNASYDYLKDGKVLMVDQVWMWVVDNATVVTFFPQRQALSLEGKLYQQADLRNSIYNEVNADLSRRCENSLDLAALVALHSVTLLFERASHRDLEIFRIFEKAISILIEKLTDSFKYFRAQGFQAVVDNDDSDDDADTIRKQHRTEGREFQKHIRQNVSALLELRDITDELLTLRKLFEEQEEAIKQMLLDYERCGHHDINGCGFLREAQQKLTEYLHRTHDMTESAKGTREDFMKVLDIVQRQANVDEARRSRWQVDLQTFQSRAIFIFTVFTIFFAPLSFFTGIFGMNTSQWAGPGGQFLSLKKIAKISLPLCFAIFGGALALALSTPVWRWVKYIVKFPFHPFETPDEDSSTEGADPTSTGTKKSKRHFKSFRRKVKKTTKYDETDFWEVNLEKKEDKYEIPDHNKQQGDQHSRKGGTWRSSHKSWSTQKRPWTPYVKTGSKNPSTDLP